MESSATTRIAIAVVAFVGSTCFAQIAGPIVAWGDNTWGQLNVPPGDYIAVTGSSFTGCAIRPDGTLATWGLEDPNLRIAPPGVFKSVVGGVSYFLAIRADDTVAAWGYNFYGEALPPPGQFRKVAAGNKHSAGIRMDGSIAYWGQYWGGTIPPGNDFIDIAAAEEYTLAVRANGTIIGWGGAPFEPPGTYTSVVAGTWFFAARRTDGLVESWPHDPAFLGTLATTPVSTISAGSFFLLALRPDGTLEASGAFGAPTGVYGYVGAGRSAAFAISTCRANCDASTTTPQLTANDFTCFINQYSSGSSAANATAAAKRPC